MPQRKEKPSKERLKTLLEEYQIKFVGPVPPIQWPVQYRHHFHIIREIWAVRYDQYSKRKDLDKRILEKQRKRVKGLREKAYSLRQEIKTTEGTWREAEKQVFKRFNKEVLWLVFPESFP